MPFPSQIVELSMRLIVMWSVPFNLGVHSSYLAVGMVYNEGRSGQNKFLLLGNFLLLAQ